MVKGEKIFKPGDKVYHHKYGWLTVARSTQDKVHTYACNDFFKAYDIEGDDLALLSFTEYTIEINGFSLVAPERTPSWDLIWDEYLDSPYVGQSGFLIFLRQYYKLPERKEEQEDYI